MRWDIDVWDALFHRALLVSIAMILYAGPASAIALNGFLADAFMDNSSTSSFDEWLPFILVIWLAAIPLVQGLHHWDDNPAASAAWLGIFLGIALLPTLAGYLFVYRAASALVILPAVPFPFQWIDVDGGVSVAVVLSELITYTLFFVVPLGALLVQVGQLRAEQTSLPMQAWALL